jgi:hypothetical protein
MEKPEISPAFTIEDIHKIREFNYNMTKEMSDEERKAYYDKGANRARAEINRLKEKKLLVNQ